MAHKSPEEIAKMSEREVAGLVGMSFYDRLRWARLQNKIVAIQGEIFSSDAITFADEMDYVMAKFPREPILVMLNSEGGEVQSGLAMYDYIMYARSRGAKVTVRVYGMAASMAAIVLQAADVREAFPNARLLIHEVSQFKFFSSETTSSLDEQVVELKKLQAILLGILSRATGKPVKKLEKIIWKKDIWFSSQEAKNFGLLDTIL